MAGTVGHWLVALVPVLAMLGLFVWLDAFKLMRLHEIAALLGLGAVAAALSYPVAGRVIDALPLGFSFYSRFIAPFIEETIKGAAIVLLFRMNRIGFKLDAVISGFAVGAGFSVVENILYLLRFPEMAIGVWLVRGLGTAVMHGTTLAVLAAIAHELAEAETRGNADDYDFRWWWFVPGYAAAVALHLIFNQLPDHPLLAMIGALTVAPIVVMGLFRFGTAEAEQWLLSERAAHAETLGVLEAGGFPDDARGRRLAALCARSGAAAGERIRAYACAQLALIVMAEGALARPGERPEGGEAAFARVRAARRELGPTLLAAVDPLLPISRNDQWEIRELEERLTRR
ncbi:MULTISPECIES: PrsW family intramembrane metalloprotease [Sphingomonas]|uniref:PrsW family intramembrane metalloprotease n=1 Tax=Sphingomonas TaxID=13687 RepID=UPI000DEF379E|nr:MULTISPECIES: PrsW family glutamic-type intramembrane protease [Sphingomonas]